MDNEICLDGLTKDELFELMLMAHERDITFNQLINDFLRDYISKLSATPTNNARSDN